MKKKDKCKDCPTRKYYARCFDIHFYGADCPIECPYVKGGDAE
jgi:hypothetical protein